MTILPMQTRIDRFLTKLSSKAMATDEALVDAEALLRDAFDDHARLDGEVAELTNNHNTAWRVACAASEGHAAIRTRYYDLAEKIGACETDSPSDIAHRLTVYVDRQTRNTEDALRTSERELDAARDRIQALERGAQTSAAAAAEQEQRIDEMKLEDFDVDLSRVELPQKPDGERLTTQELDSAVESFLSALQER